MWYIYHIVYCMLLIAVHSVPSFFLIRCHFKSCLIFILKNCLYVVNSTSSFLSGDIKPNNPRNKGKSIGNTYEEKNVVGRSSTNAELVQLLREQASWRQPQRGLGGGSLPSIFGSSCVCFFIFMLSISNFLFSELWTINIVFVWGLEFCVQMCRVIYVSSVLQWNYLFSFSF